MKSLVMIATLALLGACSEGAPSAEKKVKPPETMAAGQWQVTATTSAFNSTDGAKPIIEAKVGEKLVANVCVAAGGEPNPALFAAPGDKCEVKNSYMRGGNINLQLSCERPEVDGKILASVGGRFTADSFTATVETTSYLAGSGDYALNQDVSGKRLGDCPTGGSQAPAVS